MTRPTASQLRALPWLFRVQDKAGRGPYRPGFSIRWVEIDSPAVPPLPLHEQFGEELFAEARKIVAMDGGAVGCGCRERTELAHWFTPVERKRLKALGFRVVSLAPTRILAEAPHQVVFWRKRPLRSDALVIPWGNIGP